METPKPKIESASKAIEKAILEIIDSFDFGLVQRVMCLDPEQWGGVPKIEELKDEAIKTLLPVAEGKCVSIHGRFLAYTINDEGRKTLILLFPVESCESASSI